MQVNTNSVRLAATEKVATDSVKPPPTQPAQTDFQSSASLDAALKGTPEVRREEVERASRLVDTKNYPPPELINRLSRLLADVITSNPA